MEKEKGQVQLLFEGKPVIMEVDTGSAVSIISIISETVYKKLFQHLPLKPTHFYLKTYSGERVNPVRRISSKGDVSNPRSGTTSCCCVEAKLGNDFQGFRNECGGWANREVSSPV